MQIETGAADGVEFAQYIAEDMAHSVFAADPGGEGKIAGAQPQVGVVFDKDMAVAAVKFGGGAIRAGGIGERVGLAVVVAYGVVGVAG